MSPKLKTVPTPLKSRLQIQATLCVERLLLPLIALHDSGVEGNFFGPPTRCPS